jgi:uncharacterized surface protein with fasciclin (FAS1) repeats
MTSCGPNSQSYNFTHMFEFVDLRGNLPKKEYNKNSISYFLNSNPEFSKFFYIVKKAMYENLLNDEQANFTLFIPTDTTLESLFPNSFFTNMDIGKARNILNNCILNYRITSDLLTDSPACYFINKNNNRLFITNINNNTVINNYDKILQFDIECSNGIIHLTDNLILSVER